MPAPRSVVVVGGSLAGLRAVEALRERGFDGRLVWVGAEPHAPYDRPPLSKEILRGEWEPDRIALARNGVAALGAELRLGVRAASLDILRRRVRLAGGEELPYEGLVIATGAAPRRLPGAQRASQPVRVEPGGAAEVRLELRQTEKIGPHKRKDGTPYPRKSSGKYEGG